MIGSRWLAAGGVLLVLGALTLACGPGAGSTVPATPTADPFAVVRATSQAAYQTGRALLERGDLQGCVYVDTAKTNDPDNRTDIQQSLNQCLATIAAQMATSAPTDAPSQRPIVIATLPATTPIPPATATTTTAQTPQSSTATTRPASAATPGPANAGAPAAGTALAAATGTPGVADSAGTAQPANAGLAVWRDPQGRFTIAAPSDWSREEQPQTLFGTGVIASHDPGGRAEVSAAVDTATRAVSPELYAASMELAMNQQVPGYAVERVVPGSVAGSPSIRRVFTFTTRDASGRDLQARGFQVVVLKGSTPYIISGSAPADQFAQFSPIFDRVVESFQFS